MTATRLDREERGAVPSSTGEREPHSHVRARLTLISASSETKYPATRTLEIHDDLRFFQSEASGHASMAMQHAAQRVTPVDTPWPLVVRLLR